MGLRCLRRKFAQIITELLLKPPIKDLDTKPTQNPVARAAFTMGIIGRYPNQTVTADTYDSASTLASVPSYNVAAL